MSGDSLVRGSVDLHINPKGREEARELAETFKRKGGFWRVYTSSQARALETAHEIAKTSPNAQFMRPSEGLESWHLGGYEGQTKEKAVPEIKKLVSERPWAIPSGMGEKSTKPGESFLEFRNRVLNCFRNIMEDFENHPSKRILVVTHFHDIQMIDSWLIKYDGQPPPDGVMYDSKVYNNDIGHPLEVVWVYKLKDIWKFKRLDGGLEKMPVVFPGIYLIRHAETDWNK